jgi:hypothetical protein
VAVAALIVGLAGLLAMTRGTISDDVVVTGTSEDDGSPVGYEAPTDGTIDPVFIDYVAPVNGDERRSADRLFIDGYTWARSRTVTACLVRGGLSHDVSFWAVGMTDWYAAHASPAEARLPALQSIAEGGLDRPRQDVVSAKVSSSVERCSEIDVSKASRWQRDVEILQKEFAAFVDSAIAEVEAGAIWDATRACLITSGAPANDGPARSYITEYLHRLSEEPPSGRRDSTGHGDDDSGGSPASKDFARCAAPFYSAVEQALEAPRATFVANHRDVLLTLQDEFAAFA